MKYYHRHKGFTLVELLIVLLLAGILLSYAIPSFRDFGLRQKVSNVANGFLGDLMYARATAIKEGQSVSVDSISTDNNWAGGWTITLVSDNVLLRQNDTVNRSVTLTGTGASIVFNNFGAATTVNTITITHSDVSKIVILDVSASGMVTSRDP
jgi:prepilin-type N-terminal cleavage/methylation domain-containing protein